MTSVHKLTGPALDYCVARAAGVSVTVGRYYGEAVIYYAPFEGRVYAPSLDWNQGGALLHAAGIGVSERARNRWQAHCVAVPAVCFEGRTPLEAAMRCFVARKFGLQAPDLPQELLAAIPA
jgi:hypothetical protein